MSTSTHHKRRQPARGAKTQAAREQMSERSLRLGTLKATPNSHYLAIAKRNVKESPLLRVPPEVRNRIWKILLATEEIHLDDEAYWEVKKPQTSILRICRQVHAETCLLLYSVNLFGFVGSAHVIHWLKRRIPDQKAAIRRIRIFCSDDFYRSLNSTVDEEIHKIWGNTALEVRHRAAVWETGTEPPSDSKG